MDRFPCFQERFVNQQASKHGNVEIFTRSSGFPFLNLESSLTSVLTRRSCHGFSFNLKIRAGRIKSLHLVFAKSNQDSKAAGRWHCEHEDNAFKVLSGSLTEITSSWGGRNPLTQEEGTGGSTPSIRGTARYYEHLGPIFFGPFMESTFVTLTSK